MFVELRQQNNKKKTLENLQVLRQKGRIPTLETINTIKSFLYANSSPRTIWSGPSSCCVSTQNMEKVEQREPIIVAKGPPGAPKFR